MFGGDSSVLVMLSNYQGKLLPRLKGAWTNGTRLDCEDLILIVGSSPCADVTGIVDLSVFGREGRMFVI